MHSPQFLKEDLPVFNPSANKIKCRWLQAGICLLVTLCMCLLPAIGRAQVTNGALSGIVTDANGAVIPNAKVVMKNEASGITRDTVSNESGFFKIVALPPGTYTVRITAKNFEAWQMKGVVFNQGEDRMLPKISLRIGAITETVEVTSDATAVPIDTSESRQVLENGVFSQMNTQSRNAMELIKMMPGMAMNKGLSNSQWGTDVTSSGSGPIGAYSVGGAPPSGGVGLTSDGAAIVDIGSSNTQVANLNQEQTAELSIVNGSFGAEYAKGPVSIQAISKSGGSSFHGSAYTFTRAGSFNAEDSDLKVNAVNKPNDHFWFPGFTIGGPVVIPGTKLNRNRDKLFFFVGYEYMLQHPAGTYRQSVVPTDAMLTGDFSGVAGLAGDAANIPCTTASSTQWWYSGCAAEIAAGETSGDGIYNNFGSRADTNGMAYVTMMRNMGIKPNQDPALHTNYNYGYLDSTPTNRWDGKVKIDYNINDSTKLSGVYSLQHEGQTYPFGNMYWWPGGGVPYPGGGKASIISRTMNVSLTKVITPTLTNDFTFAQSYFTLPNKPTDPDAMSQTGAGLDLSVPFSLSDEGLLPQMPNIYSWDCNTTGQKYGCFPQIYAYSYEKNFQGGAAGNIKKVPSITDNLSKTWKTHTFKAGFYWEEANQTQSDLIVDAPGGFEFDPWSSVASGNSLADLILGNVDSFSQTAGAPLEYTKRFNWSFFATDSWKVKRLTLNYGARFDHNGQWYADNGSGLSVWSDDDYVNDPTTASTHSGVIWHAIDKSVPLSGWKSKMLDVAPRVGASYDVFGDGKTVVRGGFGMYHWQVSIGDASGSYLNAMGIGTASKGGFTGMSKVSTITGVVGSLAGGKVNVLMKGDELTPYTNNWNVIVSQAMPWKSTLELQYQGSHTDDAVISNNNNSNNSLANYNKVPLGTLLSSDECIANASYCGSGVNDTNYYSSPTAGVLQYYRPYKDYLYVSKVSHGSYSNYNAFVAQWQRQSGQVNWILNYTFGKVLGILDGNTQNGNGSGSTVDTFDLKNNYGVLAYDHTQIFNATYIFHTPKLVHNNALAGGVVNGWEISGITQMQSGAPLQANTNNFNYSTSVSIQDVLGTSDQNIRPRLTCNLKKGLTNGQYFNPSCFALPLKGTAATSSTAAVMGTNGPAQWPYIKGPMFFSSDLAIFKNFKFRGNQNIQFRVSSFNFLNHKLKEFGKGDDQKLTMTADDTKSSGFTLPDGFNGKPSGITGRRVMEFALKYEF
jgi:hypothetical protein